MAEQIKGVEAAIGYVESIPSAQEKRTEERTETHTCDCISRQAAIEINRSYHGQMPNEVNHRIWKEINELPSAQPEDCDTCKHGYFGDDQCERCRVRYPSHYERRTDEH